MPIWWRWYCWICPVSWTLYGLVASQFGDVNDTFDSGQKVGDFVKDYFGYDHDMLGVVAVVHVGLVVLFGFTFAYSIKAFNFQHRWAVGMLHACINQHKDASSPSLVLAFFQIKQTRKMHTGPSRAYTEALLRRLSPRRRNIQCKNFVEWIMYLFFVHLSLFLFPFSDACTCTYMIQKAKTKKKIS